MLNSSPRDNNYTQRECRAFYRFYISFFVSPRLTRIQQDLLSRFKWNERTNDVSGQKCLIWLDRWKPGAFEISLCVCVCTRSDGKSLLVTVAEVTSLEDDHVLSVFHTDCSLLRSRNVLLLFLFSCDCLEVYRLASVTQGRISEGSLQKQKGVVQTKSIRFLAVEIQNFVGVKCLDAWNYK